VLWRRRNEPVVIGFNFITINIKLLSPCKQIPTRMIDKTSADHMIRKCEEAYEELFLSKLETICPKQKAIGGRKKRLIVAAGIILVAVIASAGLGLAGYAVSKTYVIETRQEQLRIALDDLELKAFVQSQETKFLQKEVMKIASRIDQLVNDFNLFKEDVVELHYLISYLTSKLLEGKRAIRDTEKSWKRKEFSSEFFEYLNVTLPCKETCPLDKGIFHSCVMEKDRNGVMMDFAVPMISKNLTRVEADAFDLMIKQNNNTCRLTYNGVKVAILSIEEDCVYETHLENAVHKTALATSQKCKTDSTSNAENSNYRLQKCKTSVDGDEKEFVQVKIYDGKYYVYCPGLYYILGKRSVKCPQSVFTLPLSLTFTLDNVEYRGNVLKVIYRELLDPLLSVHINWHLNTKLDIENLTAQLGKEWDANELKIEKESENLKVFEFKENGWSVAEITTTVCGIIFGLVGLYFLLRYARNRFCKRGKHEEQNQQEEHVPLQSVSSQQPESTVIQHQIIIK